MTTIWNNDYAIAFFKENGYPEQYNDGMLAWLREVYPLNDGGKTLPDLLARYLNEYGDTFNMINAGKSAEAITLIQPAATFTSTTSTDSGSGTTTLTSAGAHGLTTAVAVGKSIYISAGTGWTPGLYEITALDLDTTGVAVTIDTPFTSQGTPTIALAGSIVPMASITIPPLRENSYIYINYSFSSTDATANVKRPRITFDSTLFFNPSLTTSPNGCAEFTIQNRGVTNSQVGSYPLAASANSGYGVSTGTHVTSSVDTSVESTLKLEFFIANANVPFTLERYFVNVSL